MILHVGSPGGQVGGGTPSARTVVDTAPKSSKVASRTRTVAFTVSLLVRDAHRVSLSSGIQQGEKERNLFRVPNVEQR